MATGTLVEPVAGADSRLAGLKRAVIVPAYNEEGSVTRVITEIRAFDPGFEIVVVDDGSNDGTSEVARTAGARVLRLPFNVGIGGAVQTGHQYARDHGFDLAIQIDGDGQHPPSELPKVLAPILADEADLVVGSRFIGDSGYEPPRSRQCTSSGSPPCGSRCGLWPPNSGSASSPAITRWGHAPSIMIWW
jgi:GT2 family glycosyltransferase